MIKKYDWSRVPTEVEWIAMDSNFDIYGFDNKPIVDGDSWVDSVFPYCYYLNNLNIPDCDWLDSLERRPVN